MSKIIKSTAILFILTIISKVIGFCRETILVSTYGASMISDVYITSMKIPMTLFAIIASAVATTFIPKFYEVEKNEGSECALAFSNNLINIVIIVSLLLSILGFVFAEHLVKLFAMDFTGEKFDLTVKFTRILVFTMTFVGLSDIMTGWLQIKEKYSIPALIGIPYNIIIILSIIISSKGNVMILVLGSFMAASLLFKGNELRIIHLCSNKHFFLLFQLPFAYKNGYKYKQYLDIKDDNIKSIILLLMPVVVGVGATQINSVIDSTLASTLGDGMITVLNSASRLQEFVTTLFITTIVSVIYPIFSRLSNDEDSSEFKDIIRKSLNIVILIIIPVSVGAIVLANPIVKILFERGKFDSNATIMTAQALRCYAIGISASGITTILNRIFYSMKDTKTPMINGVISIVVNIIFNLILINFIGHMGLALATSISALVKLGLMFRKLKERIADFGQDLILKAFRKVMIASTVMGVVVCLMNSGINHLSIINSKVYVLGLFLVILIGALLYAFMIMKMNIEEVKIILDKVTYKIKNKNVEAEDISQGI